MNEQKKVCFSLYSNQKFRHCFYTFVHCRFQGTCGNKVAIITNSNYYRCAIIINTF